ncbi:MAG: HAD family hydrolase [Ktedonobacterales bacterium]
MLPAAILFDLDDTILADSLGAAESWASVCAQYAAQFAPFTAAEALDAINAYRAWYWDDAERHRLGRLDLVVARQQIIATALTRLGLDDAHSQPLAAEMARDYAQLRDESSHLLPGALETLQQLQAYGVRLALLTNGAALAQRRKIERHQLAPFFEVIVVEGEFGVGKPDERVYRHAISALRLTPQSGWMVGDNLEWDVAAPQRLGIVGVWHDLAGAGLPVGCAVHPDRIIRYLPELLNDEPPH